jgi:hypothetical protein
VTRFNDLRGAVLARRVRLGGPAPDASDAENLARAGLGNPADFGEQLMVRDGSGGDRRWAGSSRAGPGVSGPLIGRI